MSGDAHNDRAGCCVMVTAFGDADGAGVVQSGASKHRCHAPLHGTVAAQVGRRPSAAGATRHRQQPRRGAQALPAARRSRLRSPMASTATHPTRARSSSCTGSGGGACRELVASNDVTRAKRRRSGSRSRLRLTTARGNAPAAATALNDHSTARGKRSRARTRRWVGGRRRIVQRQRRPRLGSCLRADCASREGTESQRARRAPDHRGHACNRQLCSVGLPNSPRARQGVRRQGQAVRRARAAARGGGGGGIGGLCEKRGAWCVR
jgi:hypothetical protein